MRRLLAIIALFSAVLLTSLAYAETVRVSTRENSIRKDCAFFSPVVISVKSGDSLQVFSRTGDWLRVSFRGKRGCIHKSAVEEKKVGLSGLLGGLTTGETTEDEVSLAGKGFNPQVEDSYKRQNPELQFKTVDRIEGFGVSNAELRGFMEEGGLRLP
jgi:uncharacterized protein YraI